MAPSAARRLLEPRRGASEAFGEEVRPAGFEPTTSGLEICCSIQLSYGRFKGKSEVFGGVYREGSAV